MNMKEIVVGRDFSDAPAGRYRTDGPFSGEEFRESRLVPALSEGGVVTVDLSGAYGYGSSFLEEVFGGLVRSGRFSKEDLDKRLIIAAKDPRKKCYIERVKTYMAEAWNARAK